MTSADPRAGASPRLARPSAQYALVVLLVGAALLATLWLDPFLERGTLVLFMAVVVAAAVLGGLRPGVLAMLLSVAATMAFVEPLNRPWPDLRDSAIRLGAFVVASLWISVVTERTRRFARDREARSAELRRSEERYRQIVDLADEGIWSLDGEGRTT